MGGEVSHSRKMGAHLLLCGGAEDYKNALPSPSLTIGLGGRGTYVCEPRAGCGQLDTFAAK
jgi:hypothetical protein